MQDKIHLFTIYSGKDAGSAFAKLYDKYVDDIYRFTYFKVSNESEAQDLTSQTFLKVWKALSEGTRVDNFRAFLYQTAQNLIIDFYRKRAREDEISYDGLVQELPDDSDHTDTIAINMQAEYVLELSKRLKSEYRQVLFLKYVNELSIKEIATIMKKKPGNIRTTIHRATKALKQVVKNHEQPRDKKYS